MIREFQEPGRKLKDKEIKKVRITQKEWKTNLKIHLKRQINHIRNLSTILTNPLDSNSEKEILRIKVSMIMSYYDHCIHEIIKYKTIDIFNGNGLITPKYNNFKIPLHALDTIINNPTDSEWLKQEIEIQHGRLSFMNPEKTKEALELATEIDLFRNYCNDRKIDYGYFINNLNNLNRRRNKIVHEMDIFNKTTSLRGHINSTEVDVWINLIEDFCTYIIDSI